MMHAKLFVVVFLCLVCMSSAELMRLHLFTSTEYQDAHKIAEHHGCTVRGHVPATKGVYLLECKDDVQQLEKSVLFEEAKNESIHFSLQTEKRQLRLSRTEIPLDPLYASQWHLHGPPNGRRIHVNAPEAWGMGVHGKSVRLSVVDDGMQHRHPDLMPNYVSEASFDFNDHDPDPSPSSGHSHGTSAAGVAAAATNSICGVGVAPMANVAGIRLIADLTTDAQEAMALVYGNADIYSCSWGPIDDARRLEGPGPLTGAAIEHGVRFGRRGLGAVYVWAGGNGGQTGDNCNYDGYASSRYVITVGAIGEYGSLTYYSEPCAAMLISAPTSDRYVGISTTALDGHCTNRFGGTSAATPLVAGIVALMLEAQPNATWRDVRYALMDSAIHTDPTHHSWIRNAANRMHSVYYGFGRVDAARAVARITEPNETWRAPPARKVIAPLAQPMLEIAHGGAWTDSFVRLIEDKDNVHAECVEISVWIQHPHRGDLEIQLQSPGGTISQLCEWHLDRNADYDGWTFTSCQFWDEQTKGLWTLRVRDMGFPPRESLAVFEKWQLVIHGW